MKFTTSPHRKSYNVQSFMKQWLLLATRRSACYIDRYINERVTFHTCVALPLRVSRDLETGGSFNQSSREGTIVAPLCPCSTIVYALFSVHYCSVRTVAVVDPATFTATFE
jgi:hypothetical protein